MSSENRMMSSFFVPRRVTAAEQGYSQTKRSLSSLLVSSANSQVFSVLSPHLFIHLLSTNVNHANQMWQWWCVAISIYGYDIQHCNAKQLQHIDYPPNGKCFFRNHLNCHWGISVFKRPCHDSIAASATVLIWFAFWSFRNWQNEVMK